MSTLVPKTRPKAELADVVKHVDAVGLSAAKEKAVIVGVRGYYKNTMGKPFVNDRNMYDDAVFIVTPNRLASFNANVDPARYKAGIATLEPGVYDVVKWRHQGKYDALQIVRDVVRRDGRAGLDTGRHGINFHYGGSTNTWSKGCQTLPKAQYWQFLGLVYELMATHKKRSVKYVLTEA
jgi:hypothetical protein